MKALIPASVLGLLLAATGAHAQVVYKSTMPDGKIVYGEKPAPGAKRVDTIEPPPPKTGTTVITPQEKARAEQLEKERAASTAAKQRSLEDAQQQLKKAEAARDSGKEPLPGERIGTAGGASRLTDAYHARQKSLEQAVEAARKRVGEVQAGR